MPERLVLLHVERAAGLEHQQLQEGTGSVGTVHAAAERALERDRVLRHDPVPVLRQCGGGRGDSTRCIAAPLPPNRWPCPGTAGLWPCCGAGARPRPGTARPPPPQRCRRRRWETVGPGVRGYPLPRAHADPRGRGTIARTSGSPSVKEKASPPVPSTPPLSPSSSSSSMPRGPLGRPAWGLSRQTVGAAAFAWGPASEPREGGVGHEGRQRANARVRPHFLRCGRACCRLLGARHLDVVLEVHARAVKVVDGGHSRPCGAGLLGAGRGVGVGRRVGEPTHVEPLRHEGGQLGGDACAGSGRRGEAVRRARGARRGAAAHCLPARARGRGRKHRMRPARRQLRPPRRPCAAAVACWRVRGAPGP